jgi:hypothetical protein
MKLSTHNTRRLWKATLVSLALAAVAAPQSQAKVIEAQVYRLGGQNGQSVPLVTDHGGIGTSNAAVQVFRLVNRQPESAPLVTDNGGIGTSNATVQVYRLNQQPESTPLVTDRSGMELTVGGRDSSRGFPWRDAGIGSAVLVVVAMAAATLLTVRRRTTLAKTHT